MDIPIVKVIIYNQCDRTYTMQSNQLCSYCTKFNKDVIKFTR